MLLVSGIGKGNFYYEYCFYSYMLLCLIMDKSPFASSFGSNTADAEVVDEVPPISEIPFKTPIKIVEHVMNNSYEGDGTVHPGDHLFFYKSYASCSSVQVSQWKRLRINYSHYHCMEELHIGINC